MLIWINITEQNTLYLWISCFDGLLKKIEQCIFYFSVYYEKSVAEFSNVSFHLIIWCLMHIFMHNICSFLFGFHELFFSDSKAFGVYLICLQYIIILPRINTF